MKYFILMIVVLLAPVMAARATGKDTKAPDFNLEDQREKIVALHDYAGYPLIIVAADKEGRKQNEAWIKAIRERYGTRVGVQGIADVRKVPFFLKRSYKKDFQKDPDSILLDWEGVVFKAYGFAEHVTNIVLIDKDGYIRYMHAGSAEKDAVEGLCRSIEKALQ